MDCTYVPRCWPPWLRCFSPFFLTLLLSVRLGFAEESPAVATLTHASLFAFGGVGFAAKITDEEWAYWSIFDSPTAQDDFLKVMLNGTPAGRCYALTGLRTKNRAIFDRLAKKFGEFRDTQVPTAGGCIFGRSPMSELVKDIEKGTYEGWKRPSPERREK